MVVVLDLGIGQEIRLSFDARPQVVGIYSDLEGAAPQGLSFSMTVDSRFSSRPTIIKTVAMAGALRHERAAARPEWRLPQAERLAA